MEVDKSFNTFIWKTFGNPLCVPGNCQTFYKLNIYNYLKVLVEKIFKMFVSEQLCPENQAYF